MEFKPKLCFLVGPIGAADSKERVHADWLLDGIIAPVFAEHFKDWMVERADKITAPGMIDAQVINRLMEAELVIADMSFQNANAFYEMGIRHLKGLPIIHMFLEGEVIPFDVKPYRAISFKYARPSDLQAAQVALKVTVDEVIKPGFVVENPVTRARGIEKLAEHAMEPQQVLLEEIGSLKERVQSLEQDVEIATRFLDETMSKTDAALSRTWPEGNALRSTFHNVAGRLEPDWNVHKVHENPYRKTGRPKKGG